MGPLMERYRGDEGREIRAQAAGEYQSPRIVWREPYQAMSFGVSCAKQPGNPGCAPGPIRK